MASLSAFTFGISPHAVMHDDRVIVFTNVPRFPQRIKAARPVCGLCIGSCSWDPAAFDSLRP